MQFEWPRRPLGELTVNFDTRRKPVKESERVAGPFPYYGASGIVDHVDGFLFDGEYLLVAEDGENLRTRNTPIAFRAVGKFWVNNHAHIVQGNGQANTRFLEYAVLAADIGPYLTGAVMPKLTQANLNKILVSCPPPEIQREIVGVLGSLDDRIDLLRQTNATLESIAQALFKSWFIDFDPVRAKAEGREPDGMDAETAALFPDSFQDSALGEIPQGWEISEIGRVTQCVGGGTPSTKDSIFWEPAIHHWTSPKDLSGNASPVLLNTERRLSDAGLAKVSSGLLPVGTLLMSSRAPIGYLAVAQIPLAVNQGYIAMLPGGILPAPYLYFWCKANMDAIRQKANGSTFMEISKAAFRPIPLIVPPPDIVERFSRLSGSVFDRITAGEKQRLALEDVRDSLLPRLVSGKLRLPEVFEQIEEVTV